MKKLAKIFLLIGTLTFASLSISTPLLHNHKIDFNDHYNCPAFILNVTLVSFVFVFVIKTLMDFPRPIYKIATENIVVTLKRRSNTLSNRAPPFRNL